jgi:hypothetical protein
MAARRSLLFTALGAAAVAAVALVATYIPLPPSAETAIPERIGREMAHETLRLRGGNGRVTVLVRDTAEFPQKAVDVALASFEAELGRNGAKADVVRKFQVDPLRMVQVPPGDFFELMRRAKAGEVLVSFMGPPLLSEEQRAALGTIQPRVVAFCPGYLPRYINLPLMVERGLLHGGIVARADASGDRFESQYEKLAGGSAARP